MSITPKPGYMVDPNNPNGVISNTQYESQQAEAKQANAGKTGYDSYGNPAGQVLGATTDIPLRNDQQENPNGYNGTPSNPTTADSTARNSGPSAPTRNPGESPADYATRILNSPFFLGGGGGSEVDKSSAFVFDPGTNSYVAKPVSAINRLVRPAPSQNSLSGAGVGTGSGSLNSDALLGGETATEKTAREYLDSSFKAPESEADIIARKTNEAQNRIQANKDYYQSLLTDQAGVNDMRSRETNARAVINGLSGSSEAGTMAADTATKNTQANQKILAEQNVQLQNIYADIQNSAHAEALNQKNDAYKSATDVLARKETNKTKAVADITTLSKSGFDFASIKANDPVTFQHLADSVGGEAQLNAISVLNRPQETIIDKKIENGKYVIAYQNPLTGKTRIESTDLGIPPQYTKSFDLGDRLMVVPDNFNPATDKPIYINKGIVPKAPTPTPNPTISEKKQQIIDSYSNAFSPGQQVKIGSNVVDNVDVNGFANPQAWKEAIKDAPGHGLTRAEFIKTFGHLLYVENDKIDSSYGLTPVEVKLVLGTVKTPAQSQENIANPFATPGQ